MKLFRTAILLASTPVALWAQAAPPYPSVPPSKGCTPSTPKAGKQAVDPPCAATSSAVPQSADQRFPYPGEAKTPDQADTKNAPASGPPAAPAPQSGDPARQFPYPGESSSSGSSSSNDSSSSSRSGADDSPSADTPKPETGRRILPKVKKLQSDEERESEDLDIAKYYRQAGNVQAAYLRAKDAVKLQPSDSEAHYVLADAAQHLGKKDEAISEYTAYLELDPAGDRVKNVRRALALLK